MGYITFAARRQNVLVLFRPMLCVCARARRNDLERCLNHQTCRVPNWVDSLMSVWIMVCSTHSQLGGNELRFH